MLLIARDREVEDGDEDQVLIFATAQVGGIMFVEDVDCAWRDRIHVAFGALNLTGATDAVAGLKVVSVLQFGLRARTHDGVRDGEAYVVFRGDVVFHI